MSREYVIEAFVKLQHLANEPPLGAAKPEEYSKWIAKLQGAHVTYRRAVVKERIEAKRKTNEGGKTPLHDV